MQKEAAVCGGLAKSDLGAVADDPIGSRGGEFGVGRGGAQSKDAGAGGLSGADAGGSVFEDDAIGGSEAERGRAFEIRLGMGFAVGDVAGGDEMPRQRKAGGADADFGKRTGAGGDDGPLGGAQGVEQSKRAGERNDAPRSAISRRSISRFRAS